MSNDDQQSDAFLDDDDAEILRRARQRLTELEELPELPVLDTTITAAGPLMVNVDFNDLVNDHGLTEALDMIGKLKDLLA